MAKGGSGVPAFNFLLLLFSSAVSQSVPPFYAGSYLEGSDGQAGEYGGGSFYYGSPPQHFYYPDADSDYLSTNSYQEEARVASYEDGNQFHPQEKLYDETFQSEEVFWPLELAKGLVNTFNNLISGFKQADDRQEGGGDGGGGG